MNLKSLEISDSIESIGKSAFYGCKSLQELVLPESLRKVGSSAFSNCGLERLIVPENVVLEEYDQSSFAQVDHDIHVNVTEGSWIDQNFESVFYTSGIKE